MLSESELRSAAKTFNLKPWQAQKQYLQAAILTLLSEEQLVFKGGTYLWFFHGLRERKTGIKTDLFVATKSNLMKIKQSSESFYYSLFYSKTLYGESL